MVGVETPAAVLRRFIEFLLETDGGDGKVLKVLDKVECPVLVTGAGINMTASAETSTLRIHRLLKRAPEGEKEAWVPMEGM